MKGHQERLGSHTCARVCAHGCVPPWQCDVGPAEKLVLGPRMTGGHRCPGSSCPPNSHASPVGGMQMCPLDFIPMHA